MDDPGGLFQELAEGDLLASHDGQWTAVSAVSEIIAEETVYNMRVGDFHTYFVGEAQWGFSVWAHNASYRVSDTESPTPIIGYATTQIDVASDGIVVSQIDVLPYRGTMAGVTGGAVFNPQIATQHHLHISAYDTSGGVSRTYHSGRNATTAHIDSNDPSQRLLLHAERYAIPDMEDVGTYYFDMRGVLDPCSSGCRPALQEYVARS